MDNETIVFEKILAAVKNNPGAGLAVDVIVNAVRYLELPDILTDRDLTVGIERAAARSGTPNYFGEEMAGEVMRRLFMEE